jgi:hypothetical protein
MTRVPVLTRLGLAGWVTLALAAGFAAWAGTQYASAAAGPAAPGSAASAAAMGQARDAALSAGTREIADLNSVSASSAVSASGIASWEGRWLDDTTGTEHADIQQTNAAAAAQIEKVKTSSAATVTDAALTALTLPPAGQTGTGGQTATARMIATVSVVQTNASGVSDTVANRYLATLTLTSAGWKISSLTGG